MPLDEELQPGAEEAQQDDSLAADISAAFDAAEQGAPAEAPKEPEDKGGPARDESGRFAKKEEAPAEAPAVDVAAPAVPAVEIPKQWPADVRADLEKLSKMDPALAKRWIESTRYFEGIARTERQKAEPFMRLQNALEDVLGPTRQQRQMAGMDDAAYLRALAAADQFLSANPAEGIKWLAQKYGLTPESLVATMNEAAQTAPSPEITRLMQEVGQLKSQIGQMTQGAQQQALAGVMGQIEQFATEKGPDGQLLRPFFDECLTDIQLLVQAQRERGEAVNLQAAYDKAVRMNDATWMRAQTQQAEKQAAERAAAAEKARRAGFNVAGSSGGATSEEPAESLRDELARQFDKRS